MTVGNITDEDASDHIAFIQQMNNMLTEFIELFSLDGTLKGLPEQVLAQINNLEEVQEAVASVQQVDYRGAQIPVPMKAF